MLTWCTQLLLVQPVVDQLSYFAVVRECYVRQLDALRATKCAKARHRLERRPVLVHATLLDHLGTRVRGGTPARAPNEDGHDEAERSGEHEDDADGIEVDAGNRPFECKGQDRSSSHQKDADADTHDELPSRVVPRMRGCVTSRATRDRAF